jgi:hypothetical protein
VDKWQVGFSNGRYTALQAPLNETFIDSSWEIWRVAEKLTLWKRWSSATDFSPSRPITGTWLDLLTRHLTLHYWLSSGSYFMLSLCLSVRPSSSITQEPMERFRLRWWITSDLNVWTP